MAKGWKKQGNVRDLSVARQDHKFSAACVNNERSVACVSNINNARLAHRAWRSCQMRRHLCDAARYFRGIIFSIIYLFIKFMEFIFRGKRNIEYWRDLVFRNTIMPQGELLIVSCINFPSFPNLSPFSKSQYFSNFFLLNF